MNGYISLYFFSNLNLKGNPYQDFPLLQIYHDKICVYDEHSITGRDIQYWAHGSQSEYTSLFNDIRLD